MSGTRIGLLSLAVAAVGVVVAILAWLIPMDEDGTPSSAGSTSTPTPPAPAPPTTTGGTPTPTTQPPATVRYLTELVPATGGGFVQRVGAHSLIMKCGTGESDDRFREVEYDIPRTGYRSFRTVARPTGRRETRIGVTLFVDGVVRVDSVSTAGGTGTLSAGIDGAARLTLRITCDPGAASTTFVDPALTR